MAGALIEFNVKGRVKAVYLLGMTDSEVALAEYGLARVIEARAWGWFRRLLRWKR